MRERERNVCAAAWHTLSLHAKGKLKTCDFAVCGIRNAAGNAETHTAGDGEGRESTKRFVRNILTFRRAKERHRERAGKREREKARQREQSVA